MPLYLSVGTFTGTCARAEEQPCGSDPSSAPSPQPQVVTAAYNSTPGDPPASEGGCTHPNTNTLTTHTGSPLQPEPFLQSQAVSQSRAMQGLEVGHTPLALPPPPPTVTLWREPAWDTWMMLVWTGMSLILGFSQGRASHSLRQSSQWCLVQKHMRNIKLWRKCSRRRSKGHRMTCSSFGRVPSIHETLGSTP